MHSITIRDLHSSASQSLAYCGHISRYVPPAPISESELMCGGRIVSDYPPPEPTPPTAVQMDNHLLSFETNHTTPLCLKPPMRECRRRHRREDNEGAYARNESKTALPKECRKNEEWLLWINWE